MTDHSPGPIKSGEKPPELSFLAPDVFRGLRLFALIIGFALIALYLVSNVSKVSQNEIAVIERFGKPLLPPAMPGVHFAFPYPIDRVIKVPVKFQRIYVNDFFSVDTDRKNYTNIMKNEFDIDPYCITGDNNIIKLACTVQYKIVDPVRYLYNVRQDAIKDLIHFSASKIIMHTVTNSTIDYIFTHRKDAIRDEIRKKIRQELKLINCGVDIVFIELKQISPPDEVQEAFDNVINSKNERETIINMANNRKNKNLYEAESNANRLLMEARAYQKRMISNAAGRISRFEKLYGNYLASPELTLEKLYRTNMTEILRNPLIKFSRTGEDGRLKLNILPFAGEFNGM